ncbi:Uncharacterised protein [Klebsiella oxytoca]|nr:Uncharacterised protein [Klebsiella oxytoca]
MVVILVAGHHAGGHLLAHIAHLPVNNQQRVLLNLDTGLKSSNLHTRLIQVFQN